MHKMHLIEIFVYLWTLHGDVTLLKKLSIAHSGIWVLKEKVNLFSCKKEHYNTSSMAEVFSTLAAKTEAA